MSKIKPVTCLFSLFEALNGAFDVHFFKDSFLHLMKDTDSMWDMELRLFKVKTLLHNAFKRNVTRFYQDIAQTNPDADMYPCGRFPSYFTMICTRKESLTEQGGVNLWKAPMSDLVSPNECLQTDGKQT